MSKYIFLIATIIFSSHALGDEGYYDGWTDEQLATLKDPRNRNEDISNSIVDVSVNILSDGNYLYVYRINSPSTNIGTIAYLTLDVSCDLPSSEPLGYPTPTSFSEDGKHIILGVQHLDYPESFPASVTSDNKAFWGLSLKPSESIDGLILISSEAPVYRNYVLDVDMDTYGWAYQLYDEDDSTIPWIEDFRVTGSILGPRCSTDTSPIPDDPNNPPDDGDDDNTNTDCKKGKGNAYGFEKGKGHEISKGKHLGHDHDCE